MAANDLYRCEVYMNQGSELTMNVFHIRETVSSVSERDATAAIQTYINELYQLWAEFMSQEWRVTVARVRRVMPTGGIPDTIVYGGAEAIIGQLEDDCVPPQAAILCSLYADTNDREGRGRQYLPGCGESIQNEGQLAEVAYLAGASPIEQFYSEEHGPFGTDTGKFRFNIWAPPRAVSGDYDVKVAFIHPNLATQRRRRNFPGFSS